MSSYKIFIVEDDPWYGELLKYHLSLNEDYEVVLFQDARSFLEKLYLRPHVVTIDFNLPDMSGEELLQKIKDQNSTLPVVVISGQESIGIALSLLKKGASEYIMKDDNTKDFLWNSVNRILENITLKEEVETLKEQLESKFGFEKNIIGNSNAIRASFTFIEKAIKSNINVSISGETGTGKEVVAKSIHYNGNRSKKPFIAVNMAAIPKELMESELFGHEKGAFTGAVQQKKGKFEEAIGGTLFLDEIAETDLNLQSKLLRVLQERELTRVGGSQLVPLDVRLIVATHRNLADEVQKGTFREDLYYRIMGLPIELPPLRDRGNDILILAKHFVISYAKENNVKPPVISEEAKVKLMSYGYPGNVRELKAIIELACVMSDGIEIKAADFTFTTNALNKGQFYALNEKSLKDYNTEIIAYFLKKHNNNVMEVAKKLDIGKSTIYNLISSGELKIN